MLPEKLQIPVSFAISQGLKYLVVDVLGVAVGATLKWDATSITLAQIKQKLDQLQKDIDTLLKADLESAKKWFNDGMIYLESGQYKRAYQELECVLKKSIDAFPKVKGFENKIFAKRLTIFSRLMIDTFDQETETFLPLSSLSVEKKEAIAKLIFSDIDDIVTEFEKINEQRSFVKKIFSGEKARTQNILDVLLKNTLPLIWHQIELFKSSLNFDKTLLKYVPEGEDDAVSIYLEKKWNILVWKEEVRKNPILKWKAKNKALDKNVIISETSFTCIKRSHIPFLPTDTGKLRVYLTGVSNSNIPK